MANPLSCKETQPNYRKSRDIWHHTGLGCWQLAAHGDSEIKRSTPVLGVGARVRLPLVSALNSAGTKAISRARWLTM